MRTALLLALAASFLAAAPVQAQSAPGWWDWAAASFLPGSDRAPDRRADRPRGDRRTDVHWEDDRYDDRRRDRQQGPKFCQNGQGHPVHGMAWCYEKGFGRDRYDVRWERRTLGDIVFGREQRTDRTRTVNRSILDDILGRRTLQRLEREAAGAGPLTGRWVRPDGTARVLQIRAGTRPFAELTDLDGDGRVDLALVNLLR